jgi:hypothetical protein
MTTTKSQVLPLDIPDGAGTAFRPAKLDLMCAGERPIALVLVEERQLEERYDPETCRNMSEWHTVTVPYWVVVQQPESVHAVLEGKLQCAEYELNQAKQELSAAKHELRKTAEALKKSEQEAAMNRSDAEQRRRDWVTAQESARRYEKDIGRIRTAVGEIRMKEILGPAES